MSLPPSTPLNGQKSVIVPASGFGGKSFEGGEHMPPSMPPLLDELALPDELTLLDELELLDEVATWLELAPPLPPLPVPDVPQAPTLAPTRHPATAPINHLFCFISTPPCPPVQAAPLLGLEGRTKENVMKENVVV